MTNLLKAKTKFRRTGVKLIADKQKTGGGGSWRFAGEDNLIKTIQAPLVECELEIVATMQYASEIDTNIVKVSLFHTESGENISSEVSLPLVETKKDRNGNNMYLDAEIERGKQFGYWSRVLTIRLLGLSDIDAEDVNNYPEDMDARPEHLGKLKSMIASSDKKKELLAWIYDTYKVEDIGELPLADLRFIINAIEKKAPQAKTKKAERKDTPKKEINKGDLERLYRNLNEEGKQTFLEATEGFPFGEASVADFSELWEKLQAKGLTNG